MTSHINTDFCAEPIFHQFNCPAGGVHEADSAIISNYHHAGNSIACLR